MVGSEVGAAEGTTREGYSEASKICCLCVCVVVAAGQSLCSSAGSWDRKVRTEESKGGTGNHQSPSTCSH